MRLAVLFAASAMFLAAVEPACALAQDTSAAGSQSATAAPPAGGDEDIPPGAPTDDYGFVAWCYGALGEYLNIYDQIKPQLKDIDARFGSPVQEAEPYMSDIAAEKQAMHRFADALKAAEKASATPIVERGVAAMNQGRSIWIAAKMETPRKLADAWLFWGVPNRCETTAKSLMQRSTLLGQALDTGGGDAAAAPPQAPAPATAPGGGDSKSN